MTDNSNQKTTSAARPEKPSASTEFRQCLRDLMLLRGAPTDEHDAETFKRIAGQIADEVGIERFRVATNRTLREQAWFPTPSEIDARVPPVPAKEPEQYVRPERKPGEEYFGLADLAVKWKEILSKRSL